MREIKVNLKKDILEKFLQDQTKRQVIKIQEEKGHLKDRK